MADSVLGKTFKNSSFDEVHESGIICKCDEWNKKTVLEENAMPKASFHLFSDIHFGASSLWACSIKPRLEADPVFSLNKIRVYFLFLTSSAYYGVYICSQMKV